MVVREGFEVELVRSGVGVVVLELPLVHVTLEGLEDAAL